MVSEISFRPSWPTSTSRFQFNKLSNRSDFSSAERWKAKYSPPIIILSLSFTCSDILRDHFWWSDHKIKIFSVDVQLYQKWPDLSCIASQMQSFDYKITRMSTNRNQFCKIPMNVGMNSNNTKIILVWNGLLSPSSWSWSIRYQGGMVWFRVGKSDTQTVTVPIQFIFCNSSNFVFQFQFSGSWTLPIFEKLVPFLQNLNFRVISLTVFWEIHPFLVTDVGHNGRP